MNPNTVFENSTVIKEGRPEKAVSPSDRLLKLDQETFRIHFNRRPFTIVHHLVGHPLFALPRLIELSRSLPPEDVEYNAGNLPVNMDPKLTPRTGLSIEETIRRIEDCGSWLVMKWVERDPEYRALLDRCLDEIEAFSEPLFPGMRQREAFIFISSPLSVTPYHFDQEYNFLLQVRGAKTFHVFDRSCATEIDREDRFSGAHRNFPYKEEYQKKATTFELQPGSGVHVPVAAPHWIQNGNGVSISFSITFRTPSSDRENFLYRVNRYLRRFGLSPTPVGQSPLRDSAKFYAFQALRPIKVLAGLEQGEKPKRY
jgi:hypothetical protein